jgi:hypothetical protein
VVDDRELIELMRAIASSDSKVASRLLAAKPELAAAQLVAAGATRANPVDPDAVAAGGVTPLHRAVRNRCSAAVRALLDAGADPRRANENGSTATKLAGLTTGRGGTGSPEAKAEQAKILSMLAAVTE